MRVLESGGPRRCACMMFAAREHSALTRAAPRLPGPASTGLGHNPTLPLRRSEELGKWIEVGNSGMFRPEMLRPMGLPEGVNVIAWGLSLERRAPARRPQRCRGPPAICNARRPRPTRRMPRAGPP